MACQGQPTETQYATVVQSGTIFRTTSLISSGPPIITSGVSISCPPTGTGCIGIPFTQTLPGSTIISVITTAVIGTTTSVIPTRTLYGPCSPGDSYITTPTPSAVTLTTMSSTTLAGGSVSVITQVITTSETPVPAGATAGATASTKKASIGPIVGGAVGGVVALALALGLLWYCLRKRRRWDDIFEKEEDIAPVRAMRNNARTDLAEPGLQPQPYYNGVVSQSPPPTSAGSPPPTTITSPDNAYQQSFSASSNGARPLSAHQSITSSGSVMPDNRLSVSGGPVQYNSFTDPSLSGRSGSADGQQGEPPFQVANLAETSRAGDIVLERGPVATGKGADGMQWQPKEEFAGASSGQGPSSSSAPPPAVPARAIAAPTQNLHDINPVTGDAPPAYSE